MTPVSSFRRVEVLVRNVIVAIAGLLTFIGIGWYAMDHKELALFIIASVGFLVLILDVLPGDGSRLAGEVAINLAWLGALVASIVMLGIIHF